jgi:2-(1,2-epoxy-1,2-dihydrophenyl)acetyl-CoA isomerase
MVLRSKTDRGLGHDVPAAFVRRYVPLKGRTVEATGERREPNEKWRHEMDYEQLIVEREDAVTTIRLNNPDRLNALSPTMTRELFEVLTGLRDDPGVRAIVLTGEGRGFSAGADLSTLQEPYLKGERPQLSLFLKEGYNKLIPLLSETPKPVIAAINGVVAGAGNSLALACDFRIASDAASFTAAFVRIGLIPDAGSCYFLPRTLGVAKALEFALLSEKVDAAGALRLGLVNRVVPAESLLSEATELAIRLAALPTRAIALTKQMFSEAGRLSLAETMDREAEVQDVASASRDHLEGVLAFLEKRAPSFTGT